MLVLAANRTDFANLALLLALSGTFCEAVDRVERLRRYLADRPGSFINPASVWCLAAALILPLALAGAYAALHYTHSYLRSRRHKSARGFRLVYTAATEMLATLAAGLVFGLVGQGLVFDSLLSSVGVVAAIATYGLVNSGLVWAVMWLTARPDRFRDLLLSIDEELLEQATLSLGALLAVCLVHAPALTPLTLVLMVVLRRSSLVRELQEQASRDARTGLLNAGAWRTVADRELARSSRAAGEVTLLMIDLDHFKTLNDTHGHPVGDTALEVVAASLSDTLRGYDALGRVGGEEFAALLVDADEVSGEAIAERVCARIRDLEVGPGIAVTASIGVSTAPASATDLDSLIARADVALYAAKSAGRDRVRAAGPEIRSSARSAVPH